MSTSDEPQVQPEDGPTRDRCKAIAVSTEQRCSHPAVPGTDYCSQHLDWSDVDVTE